MSRTITVDVPVDVALDVTDIDDDDLIEELKSRGFRVVDEDELHPDIEAAVDRLGLRDLEGALIHIERAHPELSGLLAAVERRRAA